MTKIAPPSQGNKRVPRKRIASGPPRPSYLAGEDVDRVMIMFTAMLSELLALRERVETHELLMTRDGTFNEAAIESYRPTGEAEDLREEKRLAILRRVFRVLRDEFVEQDFERAET